MCTRVDVANNDEGDGGDGRRRRQRRHVCDVTDGKSDDDDDSDDVDDEAVHARGVANEAAGKRTMLMHARRRD